MASAEDTINQLHQQYLALLNDETTLLGNSSPFSPEQKTRYAAAVTVAWNNYAAVQIALLNQDQATIDHINALAQRAQQALDSALKDLTTLASRLDLVTNSLSAVGTALAVLQS